MKNTILFLLSCIAILTLQEANAQKVQTQKVKGVLQNVKVIRDKWGVNHIYATNETDLFFAQG
jgi:penicillin amidase